MAYLGFEVRTDYATEGAPARAPSAIEKPRLIRPGLSECRRLQNSTRQA